MMFEILTIKLIEGMWKACRTGELILLQFLCKKGDSRILTDVLLLIQVMSRVKEEDKCVCNQKVEGKSENKEGGQKSVADSVRDL
jgi:hypothetical protein